MFINHHVNIIKCPWSRFFIFVVPMNILIQHLHSHISLYFSLILDYKFFNSFGAKYLIERTSAQSFTTCEYIHPAQHEQKKTFFPKLLQMYIFANAKKLKTFICSIFLNQEQIISETWKNYKHFEAFYKRKHDTA